MISVSVVVPVYNGENCIKQCIDSIEKNKYTDFEIIIVNDGSKDQTSVVTHALAKEYNNIHIIEIPNGGVSNARNTGIAVAKGNYIAFVDADDTVTETYLSDLVSNIDAADLVICNFRCVGNGRKVSYLEEYGKYTIKDFCDVFMKYFQYELINSPVNKLYKKEILDDKKIMFPKDMSLGEDLIFNLSYLRNCKKVTLIDSVLYNYNFISESLSTKIRDNYLEIQQKLIKELENFVKDMDCENTFNIESINRYRINTYVSFTQDVFQKNVKVATKKKYFDVIASSWKKDENCCDKDGEGFQAKLIIRMIRKNCFGILLGFFTIKEKILKPLLKY